MRHADHPGISTALAAQQIIGTHLTEQHDRNVPIDELTDLLGHINAKPAEWREALAYLAARVWSESRTSDAAAARDAHHALSQIAAQVQWFTDQQRNRERSAFDGLLAAEGSER